MAFTAPWNIAYTPKVLDPFTGHEATGSLVDEFTALFQKQAHDRFEKLIDDFNELVSDPGFVSRMASCIEELVGDKTFEEDEIRKLRKAVESDFQPIDFTSS